MDIAVGGGRKNDLTVFTVFRCIEDLDYYDKELSYIEVMSGVNLDQQVTPGQVQSVTMVAAVDGKEVGKTPIPWEDVPEGSEAYPRRRLAAGAMPTAADNSVRRARPRNLRRSTPWLR